MGTEEVELEGFEGLEGCEGLSGLDYFIRFVERVDMIWYKITNGTSITDDDYEVLRAVHRIERGGKLPFYQTTYVKATTSVTQHDLFSANVSTT